MGRHSGRLEARRQARPPCTFSLSRLCGRSFLPPPQFSTPSFSSFSPPVRSPSTSSSSGSAFDHPVSRTLLLLLLLLLLIALASILHRHHFAVRSRSQQRRERAPRRSSIIHPPTRPTQNARQSKQQRPPPLSTVDYAHRRTHHTNTPREGNLCARRLLHLVCSCPYIHKHLTNTRASSAPHLHPTTCRPLVLRSADHDPRTRHLPLHLTSNLRRPGTLRRQADTTTKRGPRPHLSAAISTKTLPLSRQLALQL